MRNIDETKNRVAKINGYPDWQALYNDLSHDQELLDFYILYGIWKLIKIMTYD